MSILLAATFHAISDFVVKNTETYFFKKGLDAVLASMDKDYKTELRKAINNSLIKYEELYPVSAKSDKFPFYHSQRIINELISMGIMDNDYDIDELLGALESEVNVITPSKKNIEDFLGIFKAEVESNKSLEKLAIKANYQAEIFKISRKLAAIESKFEHAFDNYSADLEQQWKNRLDTYVSTLKEFKPLTALSLLDALLESFKSSTKQPPQKLLGAIWFQRGVCLKLLNRAEESHKAFIKAHNFDLENLLSLEQAAFAYYKLEDFPKAKALGDSLLAADEYNPTGWVIRCLSTSAENFAKTLNAVPAIVKKDLGFRISLHNIINQNRNEEQITQLYLAGIIPDYHDYIAEDISSNNLGRQGYWINLLIHDYFKNQFFDFNNLHHEAKKELVIILNDLLKRFLAVLEISELKDDQTTLRFLLAYTDYLSTSDEQYAMEMKTWHNKLQRKTGHLTLLCANTLQIAGFTDEAIQLLEGMDKAGYEALQMLAFCYLKNDNGNGYAKTVKRVCKEVSQISVEIAPALANHIIELKQFKKTAGFSVADFIDNKTFEQPSDEALVRHIATIVLEDETAESAAALIQTAESVTDEKILALIAIALYFGGKHDDAVRIFRKYLKTEIKEEGRDLYHYIRALYHTKKDHKELLRLLESWRLNASFDHTITRLELQAYSELTNWEKVAEIGEYYLNEYPEDEVVLGRYVYALYEIGNPETLQKIAELTDRLSKFPFKISEQAGMVGQILIKTKHFAEGFEILYQVVSDPEQKELRMTYVTMFAEYRDEYDDIWPAKEFEIVEPGHFVKYAVNRDVKYIELSEQNLKQEPFKQFPGCGKGGAFSVKRPISGQEDMISIERIMNKYLYLHDLILDEVSANPYSGIPMETMNIDPNDITSIEKVLVNFMGDRGSQEKEFKTQLLEEYYNRQISFSQVIVGGMQGHYLAGYFELARRLKGINTVPIMAFQRPSASRFLLDLSSLPMIYQMVNQNQVDFGTKFVLAKYHADHIKHLLADARSDTREQMSVSVTREGVTPNFVSEEARTGNVTYLQGLSDWIGKHCEVRLSPRVLDFTRQISVGGLQKELVDYLVNTVVILEDDPELGMISDDTIFYNLGVPLYRIISTEYFAKSKLPAEDPALDQFIINQYRGFTVSVSQLNEQHTQNLAGNPNHYALCLENLSASNNPHNITTAVLHVRWLVLNAILGEAALAHEISTVFKHLLEGVKLPGIKAFVRLKINEQFKLLGNKQDVVLRCLDDAISNIHS